MLVTAESDLLDEEERYNSLAQVFIFYSHVDESLTFSIEGCSPSYAWCYI